MSYPTKGLSIDIGNDKIKIIEYKRSRDKVKIKKALLIDTPDNCLDDGMITQMDALVELIGEELKNHRIREKKVLFTVASSKIITREVDLPDLPKKKLDALIKMNAEEYFPVDLSEYTTDYRILDHYIDGEDKLIRVNMVAAFTELMDAYINLAGLLNLKVVGIDFAGNSIVNYAGHMKKEGTYLLLDLGSNSTMVTIMSENVPRFNRNLIYGTSVVINSIQNHFNVRYKEAVKISGEQSLLKEEASQDDYLSGEVTNALNQILSGVARLVDFYTSRNKEGIEKIYIVGGGTKIEGIKDYIAGYFNVETEVVKELDTVSFDEEELKDQIVFLSNSIGAVYSDMNLLPKEFLNRDKQKAAGRLRLELGVLVILLLGGAMYLPYLSVQNLEKEKIALQDEIDEKSVVLAVKAQYDAIVATQGFYSNVDAQSSSTTEAMLAIIEMMEKNNPEEIEYLSMNNSEEGLIISGIAADKLAMVNFIINLKSLELDGETIFSNVYVPGYINPEADLIVDDGEDIGYYTFSVACEYNMEVAK